MIYGFSLHYNDVIMSTMASQITSLMIVYSTAFSGADQRNIKAPRHWLFWGEFTGAGEFPAQRASNAENVSIWWRSDRNPIAPLATLRPRHLQRHFQFDFFYEHQDTYIILYEHTFHDGYLKHLSATLNHWVVLATRIRSLRLLAFQLPVPYTYWNLTGSMCIWFERHCTYKCPSTKQPDMVMTEKLENLHQILFFGNYLIA